MLYVAFSSESSPECFLRLLRQFYSAERCLVNGIPLKAIDWCDGTDQQTDCNRGASDLCKFVRIRFGKSSFRNEKISRDLMSGDKTSDTSPVQSQQRRIVHTCTKRANCTLHSTG